MFTEQLTQALAVVDVINTSAINNTNSNSAGVNMAQGKRLIYYIGNQGLGAAGTIDGRLQSSPNANFNVVHNLAGTNITQMTVNNTWTSTEVRADQVTSANSGDKYVRLQLTGGGNAITGVVALGLLGDAIQKPGGANYNLNSQTYVPGAVCSV